MKVFSHSKACVPTGVACKRLLLLAEAERWLGVQEKGGNNKGEIVSLFQGWDDKVQHQAWCMAFVQFCLKQSDIIYDRLVLASEPSMNCLFSTEHVMTAWVNTPEVARREKPEPGLIAIWQRYKDGKQTSAGHTGIVTEIVDSEVFCSIEGNTKTNTVGDKGGGADGVFQKERSYPCKQGSLQLKGFLDPWCFS